jgi:hypothetical protein
MDERKSSSDVARERAAFRDIVPGLVALVVLQGSLVIIDPDGGASAANLVWSLLPLLPVAWLVWAQVRSLHRADEYQRMLQLEAMAIGFGVVVVLGMVGGLLDGADVGDPRQSLQITVIAGILSWVAALVILMRRAR